MTTTNTLHAVNTIAVIRPLTGEFADSRLELAFRNSTWEQVVRQQRSSLLILAVLVLAFALPDFVAMEAGPALWLLATYRALFALALLVGIEALRRAPELGLHGHLLMWLALLGYPFLFLFCALRPELRMFNIATVMVMQIGVFLFWPIRLLLALPVVLLGATGETLCIGWFSADLNDTLATGFSVCMPAVLGYFFALRLQTTARQQFWLSQQLQFVNHELSGEIARRVALQEELEHQATTDMLTGPTGVPLWRAAAPSWRVCSAVAKPCRSPCWTWTISSRSMTGTAMPPVMPCCAAWDSFAPTVSVARTWLHAWAVRSFWCCFPAAGWSRPQP